MVHKQTVSLLILVLITVTLSGCVSLDDYLEIALDEEPKVVFEQELVRSNADTLLLMGIEDANIINRVRNQRLDFYVHNTNDALIVVDVAREINTKYLLFTEMYGKNLDILINDFPQLADMSIFILYLKGMKVNGDNMKIYTTLSDGEYRHVSPRNADLINDREVVFIAEEVETSKAALYDRLALNSYKPLHRK